MHLREALVSFSQGWKADLSPAWRESLAGVEPAVDAVDPDLTFSLDEPIFPGRKGNLPKGAPAHSHVFRALDGIEPAQVRVVIVGQDPYPNVAWATGRSFEQGNLSVWPSSRVEVADSLERIIPSAMAARTGQDKYIQTTANGAWPLLFADIRSGALSLQAPMTLFDYWQSQGVLFLNAGLTLTRFKKGGAPEQLRGHIPFWRPVVQAILDTIVERSNGQVVFLLWGNVAQNMVRAAGIRAKAQASGAWGDRVRFVTHPHPAAAVGAQPAFFRPPNPFFTANAELKAMGADPIQW